jgi:hypothetical protein
MKTFALLNWPIKPAFECAGISLLSWDRIDRTPKKKTAITGMGNNGFSRFVAFFTSFR